MAKPVLKYFLKKAGAKHLLILCHANADVDSMASALALYFSFSKKIFIQIGVPEHCNEEAQLLCKKLGAKFIINPELSDFDAVILVDFNEYYRTGKMKKSLLDFSKPVLVFDHHSKTKQSVKTKFSIIDSTSPSTAFIVLKELQQSRFIIPKKAFLALASGMLSDSSNLLLANADLLEQISFCLKKTNSSLENIRSLYRIQEDISEKIAKLKSIQRMQLFEINGFLVALSRTNFFESQSAMALISSGADLSFVAGTEKKSSLCRLIARASLSFTKKTKLHLAKDVCTKLPVFFGGHGNGHSGAAGFSSFNVQPEIVLQKSLELATDFFRKKEKNIKIKELI